MKKHIIWSTDINLEDWKDFFAEEHPDVTDPAAQYEIACRENQSYLGDEQANLNLEVDSEIIMLMDIQRWDGHYHAYLLLHSENLADCLKISSWGNPTWYLDELGDLCCEDAHHDGVNHYTFRAWQHGLSQKQKDNFLDKFYWGKATRKDVTRYTRTLGSYVANVYGWTREATAS